MEPVARYKLGQLSPADDGIELSVMNPHEYEVLFHCHDFFEIFIILEGTLLHEVNGAIQTLSPCMAVFIRPDDIHRYSTRAKEQCRMVRLSFTPCVLELLAGYMGKTISMTALLRPPVPLACSLTRFTMEALVQSIERLLSLPYENKRELEAGFKLLLAELALKLTSMQESKSASPIPYWLDTLCAEMVQRENFVQGVPRLFALCLRSREYVSRSFRRYLGISPTEYVNGLKLNYATNQLIRTDKKITEICFDSGFDNLSHFYQCFEKAYGATPGSFRKANALQYGKTEES